MPKEPGKYQANHSGRQNNNQASDSSKKAAKVAAKGAANYFTGGKGGAVVDKLADTKLGNAALDKAGKIIDNNKQLQRLAKKLDDKGVTDKADKAMDMTSSKGGQKPGADLANKKSPQPGASIGDNLLSNKHSKSSDILEEDDELGGESFSSSIIDEKKGKGSFDIPITVKMFLISHWPIIVGILFVGILLFSMSYTVLTVLEDENNPNGTNCLNSDLQAEELCRLHDERKYEEWIELFGPVAQQDYSNTGVFASVTMAQVMYEAGWGCSDIKNNIFGIKCHGYSDCTMADTQEVYSGKRVSIKDSFRVYPSLAASIEDHSKFLLENPVYTESGVFSAKNYKEQIYALKKAGYATEPTYATRLIEQIEYYNLDRYDVVVNSSRSSGCGDIAAGDTEWPIRTVAPTASDKAFTYKNSNRGQCVWYAQARAIEIVEYLQKKGKLTEEKANTIKNKLLNTYGNGGDWYDVTRNTFPGSNKVNDVKPGSIISWKKPGGYGHVAIIEEVTKDSVTVTEGWANGGNSCPNSWSCVRFINRKMSLDEYKKSYGKHNTGNYVFSGYVYFLEG